MRGTRGTGGHPEQKEKKNSDFECSENSENELSHANSQCIREEKKEKIKLRKQRIYKKKCHGLWTAEQEGLFVAYMKQHQNIFEDKELRRAERIFKKMSRFLKTRSPDQCRSHHQKYEIRFGDFKGIVQYLQTKLLEAGNQDQPFLDNFQLPHQARQPTPQLMFSQQQTVKPHGRLGSKNNFKPKGKKINLTGKLKGGEPGRIQDETPFFSKIKQMRNKISSLEQLTQQQLKNSFLQGQQLKVEPSNVIIQDLVSQHRPQQEYDGKQSQKGPQKQVVATSGGAFSKNRDKYQAKLKQQGFLSTSKDQRGVDIYEHGERPQFLILLCFEEFFEEA